MGLWNQAARPRLEGGRIELVSGDLGLRYARIVLTSITLNVFLEIAMREQLESYCGKRIRVTGQFDTMGGRRGRSGFVRTALFQFVELDGAILCGHCHVQFADTMVAYDLRAGERVRFSAQVRAYRKWVQTTSHDGPQVVTDYGLYNPTGVVTLDRTFHLPSLVVEGKWGDGYPHGTAIPAQSPRASKPPEDRAALASELQRLAHEHGGYESLKEALNYLCG